MITELLKILFAVLWKLLTPCKFFFVYGFKVCVVDRILMTNL